MIAASAALLWLCAAGAAFVFVAMLYSIVRFPHAGRSGTATRNLKEFAWALVPIAIVVGAAAPAIQEQALEHGQRVAHRSAESAASIHPVATKSELEVRTAAARR